MVVHVVFALPLGYLIFNWALLLSYEPHSLGFNPQEMTHHITGDWALRLLLITLCISPVALWRPARSLMTYRRMAGLWSFAYVVLHILSYLWLEKFFDWSEIWGDLVKRPYITIGMITFISLLPLAVTSTNGWIKRLGSQRWRALHRLIYLAALLAPLHFIMMRKGLQLEPRIYAIMALTLIAVRLLIILKKQSKKTAVNI